MGEAKGRVAGLYACVGLGVGGVGMCVGDGGRSAVESAGAGV